jgi:uncharacterized repeat protein (TIGR03806 family)
LRLVACLISGSLSLALIGLAACSGKTTGPDLKVILADQPAKALSAYGFDLDHAGEAGSRLVPYDLTNALFSDHAAKHRLVFVPDGKTITYKDDGAFAFPVGSVLIKTFAFAPDMRVPDRDQYKVETRLLIRKESGWVAYPYIWNEQQTVATYAPVGGSRKIETVTPEGRPVSIDYQIPNRNQCKTCHQTHKSMTPIGPSALHLNHDGQLQDWAARGLLTGVPAAPPSTPVAFDEAAPIDGRARAWLDINCAHCHSAGGGASNSGLFLGWDETDPTGWGVHKRPVAAGRGAGTDTYVIEPGHPDRSILAYRLESVEPGVVMPELGRTVVDEKSLALIRDWIAQLPAAATQ